jgi:hypothetical protein
MKQVSAHDTSKMSVSAIAAELDSEASSENLVEEFSEQDLPTKMDDTQLYDLRSLYRTGTLNKNPQSLTMESSDVQHMMLSTPKFHSSIQLQSPFPKNLSDRQKLIKM